MPTAARHAGALTDPARIRVLAGIDFDNPDLRAALDRIAARTAARTGLPISLVTLVFDTAQLTAGTAGLDDSWIVAADGTPVEWSFCANTVTTGRPYVIADTADSEQATNPLVTIDGIGSYAGVPITLAGQTVGAHCILGTTTHQFTSDQLAELHTAGQQITTLLQQYSDH
ncbi:GAF domain-containing protein [Actinoplanes xinjiangensis]|uniref:GAF domain-containing protein n=1 Tax=Actinoplanes xinjiangensis TaxID=512350 RepID=UPI003420C3E6